MPSLSNNISGLAAKELHHHQRRQQQRVYPQPWSAAPHYRDDGQDGGGGGGGGGGRLLQERLTTQLMSKKFNKGKNKLWWVGILDYALASHSWGQGYNPAETCG